MRIYLAQLNPTVGALESNLKKILQAAEDAHSKECQILVTSELALCGYPPEDLLLHEDFIQAVAATHEELLKKMPPIAMVVGTVRERKETMEKRLCNSALVAEKGKLLGFYDKKLLPTYDVFDERRYFSPGNSQALWELGGLKVGISICEDIWEGNTQFSTYTKSPLKALEAESPHVLINLSSSPFSNEKKHRRLQVCQGAAKRLSCPVLLCNQVGGNDSLIFDGHSMICGKSGELLQVAKGFEEDFLIFDSQRPGTEIPLEENTLGDLHDALVLGLRDYFQKLGFKKACLGLSGGIDSALVACLAAEALGPKNVLGITMPSRYSSEGSWNDSRVLAKQLGIEFKTIPIEKPFEAYLELLEPHFEGLDSDVTEENLQARIRGMLLMAFSNKFGHVLLATGNKSELALGYCTLYGDMCGGLAVISDVTKRSVYQLSSWINRNGEIIPESTLRKPPSAELRPDQKDSDSLPDYDVVDAVVREYVEGFSTVDEICQKHSWDEALVKSLIKKIHQNEYKRRQAPPGLRVTDRAFSTGRRLPIVQSWA